MISHRTILMAYQRLVQIHTQTEPCNDRQLPRQLLHACQVMDSPFYIGDLYLRPRYCKLSNMLVLMEESFVENILGLIEGSSISIQTGSAI